VGALEVGLGWWRAVAFGLMLVMMQGGGQSLNQSNSKEVELDRLNGKTYRPTVSGILSVREARTIAYGCLGTGALLGLAIGVWWLGLAMASTAILYTQEPFYLKRFFPFNLLVQAAGRGFLPLFTLGYISGHDTLPLATFFFVWVFALQSTKDFGDAMGDKAFGVRTLPVMLGKTRAKYVMLGITFCDYAFALASGMWFLLAIAPLDISAILTCEKDWKVVENSIGWALYYASLGIGTVIGLAFI
ncbi:MAG: UbiA family prenyltransferase, partial [Nitrososphaerales archaeon]